ncbi:hypothetical protein GVX82_02940 [Patescibacteria group bacterium]|jgi:hypothetical protein|nr:hypothetical protein [Patescibacteria group bacterium]
MNRRTILSSFALVVALGAVYVGATGAFFTDTYASEDNVFATEGVEIVMSSIGHTYLGTPGVGESADPTGFSYDDVEGNFDFTDIKPQDWGTLDFDIDNQENEAYVCAYIAGTAPSDAEDVAFYNNIQFYNGDTQLTFNDWVDLGVLTSGETTGLEVDYCFGNPTVGPNGIVNCAYDSSIDYNAAQDGDFSADFYLFAIQTRNNSGFTCDALEFDPNVAPEDAITLDETAFELTVGAEVVAYETPAETGATCDLTVDESLTSPVDPFFGNITDAEAAAEVGETICVDTGNYEEDVTVDVEDVTILGINDPKGGDAAVVDGRMDIEADGVTVSGLAFTNPDAGYGIVIDGVDNTVISFNTFTNIGTAYSGASAQAIYYDGNPGAASGLVISDNTIDGVGSEALDPDSGGGSSAKGIFIGDSTSPDPLTDVLIENNVISDIDSSNAPSDTNGKGAYGILINYGVASTGSAVSPIVRFNTISGLIGSWAHVVGLETDTPGAMVSFNDLSNATGENFDSEGVFFEGNPNSDVDVVFNNLAPGIVFGVAIHPSNSAISVNAENNWWGDIDPSDDVAVNGTGSTIDFTPSESSAYPTN